MKKLGLLILLIIVAHLTYAQKIIFKRVCNGGNNNNLTWYVVADGCTIFGNPKLYGSESIIFPFTVIDNSILVSNNSYSHLNANVPSNKDWRYFFSYQKICGIDTLTFYTDTLSTDTTKPEPTYLDSVSVNPLNNTVIIGWSSNKTPDFSSYYLYNYDRADPRLAEKYRDTFYYDINPTNPSSKSLSYDITSSDSCDNRREFGNIHKTILLNYTVDTCKNKVNLSWGNYVGWKGIRSHHIYRKINAGSYLFLDSVLFGTNSYQDITLPSNSIASYFIRTFSNESGYPIKSSSSNSISCANGKSINPKSTKIEYVTNNSNQQIEIKILPNPFSNYGSIELYSSKSNESPLKIHSFNPGEIIYQDLLAQNTIKRNYILISKNVCNQYADTSLPSNNITLSLVGSTSNIQLNWDKYFTWNTGVKEYVIYRSTANNIAEAINFLEIGRVNLDSAYTDPISIDNAMCYYISAIESAPGNNTSNSNIACYSKTGTIYFPNAITLNGLNNTFNFYGIGIELDKSNMTIYNRWGELIYAKENLINGWTGTNMNNTFVDLGVYFFMAEIKQANEMVKLHGNITVIK